MHQKIDIMHHMINYRPLNANSCPFTPATTIPLRKTDDVKDKIEEFAKEVAFKKKKENNKNSDFALTNTTDNQDQ